MSFLTHLECTSCHREYKATEVLNLCACGNPLFARYDLKRISKRLQPTDLTNRQKTIWKYRELLPVTSDDHIVTLGEGGTPLISARTLGQKLGIDDLFIKD